MPAGAKVLSVGAIGEEIFVWADVDTKAAPVKRWFIIIGTGWNIDVPLQQFIGTVIFPNQLVFHVFETKE